MSSLLARGAGHLWGWVGQARGHLYDSGFLKRVKLPVKVVSVGNLTVGGTGKTPVVQALAELFAARGLKAAIVSRNYKAEAAGPVEVDLLGSKGADYYGDEPFLLAKSLPGVPVFVGPKKSETAAFAFKRHPDLDVILIDDGFQHRALARDFDLVLIDATDEKTFEPLPAGRGRENPDALNRADWILLTKTNWAGSGAVDRVRALLPSGKRVSEAKFQTSWPDVADDVAVGVFAGIARPEVFFDLARKKYFQKVRKTWAFRDHQVYGEKELGELRDFLRAHPGSVLVTTEKDAVKIQDRQIRERMLSAKVKIEWKNAEELFERLRTLDR